FDTASGGGESGGNMVEFLKAISKPLQGMGVAFSASLFGLSGSLITGLLNSFCGKGMDRFLEDFSNWIDARIPAMPEKSSMPKPAELDPVAIIDRHNQQVMKALEETLAGFARQSQHMVAMFSELIGELTEFGTQQSQLTKQLAVEKRETLRLAGSFESGINALSTHLSGMSEAMMAMPIVAKEMRNDVRATQQAILTHQQMSSEQMSENARQQAVLANSLNGLFEGNRALTGAHQRIAEALEALRDDTMSQKDKIIEMVVVMQHVLQVQLGLTSLETGSPLLQSNKGA
ncbi:MAG: hypothetical protein K2Q01_00085, partial [Rickettsiales bacterium]|nr:hypothetical protein [Rickettsiales bacterium]